MRHAVYLSIVDAVRSGRLSEPFTTAQFQVACPGFGAGTYKAFLHKHSARNPGGASELFQRVAPGAFTCCRPFLYQARIAP